MDGVPVAVVEGGVVYYVRTDHIGRPVFATDSTGAKVWEATYLPFGEVLATSGNPIQLRFPGQWFQAESGLHQNWMRDYDPTTGRYMQADPLGLVDGASVYGYAGQNPLRYVDPRGEFAFPLIPIAYAAGAATVAYIMCKIFCEPVIEACVLAVDDLIDDLTPVATPTPTERLLGLTGTSNSMSNEDACHAAYDLEATVCRMLNTRAARNKCWRQAADNLAQCIGEIR